MKPQISVLVDTYNQERYIEQALASVLEQGLSPAELEIVVVDDGSTDNTPSIIRKFLPRVKYLRKKNGGQASAFNAAFPEVNGEAVAILDGDDWFGKGKLAAVIDALEQNPEVSAVSHAYYEFYEESKELKLCGPARKTFFNLATPEAARSAADGWRFLPLGALTVRRKLLERVMPLPEELVFSADNPIQTAAMAMGVLVLETPLSYYRRHAENRYAVDPEDAKKMRRKCEMIDLTFGLLHPMLLRLGVSEECVSALLDEYWIYINRFSLTSFGGSRLKTFRTEMRSFRMGYKNPSAGYRAFKYLVVGAATLLLPPKRFYKLRNWYGNRALGRYRERLVRENVTASQLRRNLPGE
jgi:glycosyltransferase involved in cell wall biosynthesis